MAERRTARDRGGDRPGRLRLLLAGVVVTGLWVLGLLGLRSVFADGAWLPRAILLSGAVVLGPCLLRFALPRLRTLAVAATGVCAAALWLWWSHSSGRLLLWIGEPSVVLERIQAEILQGSAPMEIGGALQDLLLGAVLLWALVSSLVLTGVGGSLPAGLVVAPVLLAAPVVTSRSADWLLILGAGLLLALLAWIGSPSRSVGGLVAAGLAVALAAGAVAIAPATRDRVWNDSVMLAPVGGAVPDVTIALAEDLRQRSSAEAFSYVAEEPAAMRFPLATLSDFSGGRWAPQNETDARGLDVSVPRGPEALVPDEGPGEEGTDRQTVEVTIGGLVSPWLPLPQSPVQVVDAGSEFDPEEWVWARDANTARSERTTTRRGDQYRAVSGALVADDAWRYSSNWIPAGSQLLHRAPAEAPEELAQYLALPESLPDEIADQAERTTAGAGTRIDVGFALQDWFRSGRFSYDEASPYAPGSDPGDPYAVMEAFLAERRGFCVHYASTFAVMARSLGVPTRIAVGYASRAEPGEETSVRGTDLHAWPEIYVDDVGWLAFEPTPGGAGFRADGDAEDITAIPAEPADRGPARVTPSPEPEPSPTPEDPAAGPSVDGEESGWAGAAGSGLPAALGLVGLLALILLGRPAVGRVVRTRRRLRAIARAGAGGTGRPGVRDGRPASGAWDEFSDTALDLGFLGTDAGADAGAAPRARTAEALIEHLAAVGALRDREAILAATALADAAIAERYGGEPSSTSLPASPGSEDAGALGEQLRLGTSELRRNADARARLRAAVLPRSMLRRPVIRPVRRRSVDVRGHR